MSQNRQLSEALIARAEQYDGIRAGVAAIEAALLLPLLVLTSLGAIELAAARLWSLGPATLDHLLGEEGTEERPTLGGARGAEAASARDRRRR